jgi:Stress responsive A/B Barrel Domain.
MVTNVMLIKLKDRSPENVQEAQNILLSMNGKIPQLVEITTKTDTRHAANSYDFAAFATYKTKENFEAYVVHPYHVEVGGKINEMAGSIVSVFY